MFDDHWSFPSESVNAELPSFPPPPLDEVLKALELDEGDPFPTLPDIPFPTYPYASTLSLAPSSESTYSMPGLTEDISNTGHSAMSVPITFNYPPLFNFDPRDIVFGSEDNYVDFKHNSVISDSSTFPDSSGNPQLSFQHDHVVAAQLNEAPDRQLVGISPHCLSAAFQSPSPAVPIDPPADAASTSRVFTGPIRTKPTCDQCGRGKYNFYFIYIRDTQCCFLVFDRPSNLKAHMKTHDLNRERPYVCPESDCGYRFTRSNDRKRHLENINIHGVLEE
jgi:hypothetical protein